MVEKVVGSGFELLLSIVVGIRTVAIKLGAEELDITIRVLGPDPS
jgi:hypothetical protein